MNRTEFDAGDSQRIVVYSPADTGEEVDVAAIYGEIAVDAKAGAADGWRIVSTSALPVRHAQGFMAREGSGYETKMAVAVVYAKS